MKRLTLAQQKREDEKIKRKRALHILIKTAFERGYSESEMIDVFNVETGETYEIKKDNDEMISELEYEGYTVTKFDSLVQEMKFNDFMDEIKANPYQLTLVA